MLRNASAGLLISLTLLLACRRSPASPGPETGPAPAKTTPASYLGFDRNLYPGDDRIPELRQRFAFIGYWLTPPPGETINTWTGKRRLLRDAGFGFLVLANGRLDHQIKASKLTPARLGQSDAAQAIAAAGREGFPSQTIIFIDQEEGGHLLPEQSAYLFAWTEAVAASHYRPGAYLSGQPSPDGTGSDGKPATITTAADVQQHLAAEHLHSVDLWVYQGACPPAPGCVAVPPLVSQSGTPTAIVWQYAQSPRRPEAVACAFVALFGLVLDQMDVVTK